MPLFAYFLIGIPIGFSAVVLLARIYAARQSRKALVRRLDRRIR